MNNRIKELAEQAKNETIKEFGDRTFQWDDFYYRRSEILAELIVRECATLAYDGPGGILEHFGVKDE
jgi:hypothetical protein